MQSIISWRTFNSTIVEKKKKEVDEEEEKEKRKQIHIICLHLNDVFSLLSAFFSIASPIIAKVRKMLMKLLQVDMYR